jgi:hypothetical protein
VKNSDLVGSIESINALAALKQPVQASFAIALNLKAVRDHITVFKEQQQKIVDKYTGRDADGKPLPAYDFAVDKNGKSILDEKGDPILGPDEKPVLDKDGNPPKVLENQVRITDPKAFRNDLRELDDMDVTDEVKIRPIKLSLLEGLIEPQLLVSVIWMINDDVSEKTNTKTA